MDDPVTQRVKRKVLLHALSSPLTVLPFVAGITALVGMWVFGLRADIGVLAGVAGVFGSAGVFITNLILKGEAYAVQALQETQVEERADHESELDSLDVRLCRDNDPRTEAALRDLRSLVRAFQEYIGRPGLDVDVLSSTNIESAVQELHDQCVNSLERSLQLWETAAKLHTRAAREPILKEREDIIGEVGHSIRQLGEALASIQTLGLNNGATSELVRIGQELDQRLAVAKQVEQRVRTFESQLQSSSRE